VEDHHSFEVDSDPVSVQALAVLHTEKESTNLAPVWFHHLQTTLSLIAQPMILLSPISLLNVTRNVLIHEEGKGS
jgi:hypothetical protein